MKDKELDDELVTFIPHKILKVDRYDVTDSEWITDRVMIEDLVEELEFKDCDLGRACDTEESTYIIFNMM